MPTIYIDNQAYQAKAGVSLLEAVLSLGLNLEYFCWHPAMGSVGACRQCAITVFKDEHDTKGHLVMACMTAVRDGLRLSIRDGKAREFRARVIEWLMTNHPHDCPVCDEGGECHLQDMTVMTGHDYRRYRFAKRTFNNQDLGPFVNHELNRCIACYRCTRFYNDYAGGRDFGVFGCHNTVYFGRSQDGPLESEFSGNLVEVCPTGVFTDKTLKKHYTRKWDLMTAPSVCVHCGLGCNTIPGERYGQLRRIHNRYNSQVNGYFLCDRGRYGYEFVNDQRRVRGSAGVSPANAAREILKNARGLIGIGSPRASLESNFALRQLVGEENFYRGESPWLDRCVQEVIAQMRSGPAVASLREIEECDAVLVLGEDLTNFAPRMALALRQSVRRRPAEQAQALKIDLWLDQAVRELTQSDKGPLFVASPSANKLDDIAAATFRASPADIARLARNVKASIGGTPVNDGLTGRIAQALMSADKPLIVSGCGCGSVEVIRAAGELARALQSAGKNVRVAFTVPECNSLGLGLMGGQSLDKALEAVRAGRADTVVVLENDLYRRLPPAEVEELLGKVKLIALDYLENPTSARADVVLPAATFAECSGTLVNNEGRAQRFFQVFVPNGVDKNQPAPAASWRWLGEMGAKQWPDLDAILTDLAQALLHLAGAKAAAPPADFRIAGMKVARQPGRYSGRTAMTVNISVHEPKPPEDADSPLAFSMEGYEGVVPAPLVPRFWAAGWNSVQAVTRFQEEVNGPLRGGPAGVRLIESGSTVSSSVQTSQETGQTPVLREKLLVVPGWHIYGSEELSMHTPGLAGRAPQPYLGVSPEDAQSAGAPGREVTIRIDQTELKLAIGGEHCLRANSATHEEEHCAPRRTDATPERAVLALRIEPSLPEGLAVLGMLPGVPAVELPAWIDWPPGGDK